MTKADKVDKHKTVLIWLEKIYGNPSAIPSFELNDSTLDRLYTLSQINEDRNRRTQIVIEDLKQKTEEYRAEGIRLRELLQATGLVPEAFSQFGVTSLRLLSSVAVLLKLKDTSTTSFFLAIDGLISELEVSSSLLTTKKNKLDELIVASKETHDTLEQYFKKIKKALEEHGSIQSSLSEQRHERISFLEEKAASYISQNHLIDSTLAENGYETCLAHDALSKQSEELTQLTAAMTPLRTSLERYKKLPPDLSLARVAVEVARLDLLKIEKEISKKLDFTFS